MVSSGTLATCDEPLQAERTATLSLTVSAAPAIAVSANPTTVTLLAGGATQTTTLTYTRTNFTGSISIAHVSGLPAGVTTGVDSSTTTGNTKTLAFSASVSTVPGTYNTVWEATGTGATPGRVTIALTVTAPAGSITLSASPDAQGVTAGGSSVRTVITVTRTNYTGDVTFGVEGGPPAWGVTFIPQTTSGNTTTATITVTALSAPGTYTANITASGNGIAPARTPIQLTVTAPPASRIFVQVSPSVLTVARPGAGEAFLDITRTNFNGPVTLGVVDAPPGVLISFDAAGPTMSSRVRLTVSVNGNAPLGTFPVTIIAQGAGVASAIATFGLEIMVVTSRQVDFLFCSSSDNPVFFAVQEGAGDWRAVTATQVGSTYRYRFQTVAPIGGVFYVQQSGSALTASRSAGRREASRPPWWFARHPRPDLITGHLVAPPWQAGGVPIYETTVIYATIPELATIGADNCAESQPTRTVNLPVAGVGAMQQATLSLGGETEVFEGGVSTSPVQFSNVRSQSIDFFGTRESSNTGVPNRILDARALNPADGSTLPFTADFDGPNAYNPASAQLTIGNALGDPLFNFASFYTANGEVGLFGGVLTPSTATTRTWYGVPSAKLQSGDLHQVIMVAVPAASPTDEERFQFLFSTAVQNLSPALGPRLANPTASVVGTPSYRRVRLQGTVPSEYSDLVSVHYQQSGGGQDVTLLATKGWRATYGAATFDLTTPDLSALAGLPATWAPPPGQWDIEVYVYGLSGLGILNPAPTNGATVAGASKTVRIVVP
jgi:hypothetical protein